MADTHINAFITEFEEAYKEAMGAIDTLKQKADTLLAKYKAELDGSDQSGSEDGDTAGAEQGALPPATGGAGNEQSAASDADNAAEAGQSEPSGDDAQSQGDAGQKQKAS